MKKFAFLLPFFSILIILFISCNQKGSGEAYTLKMRLAKGDIFKQELDMDMDMSFDMMGQQMKMEMGMKGANDFEVLADSGNLKNILMTYRKAEMSMAMTGMPGSESVNYDEIMKQASAGITGKKVVMRLNNKNEIVEVAGFEDVMSGDSTQTPEVREQLRKFFSKDQMNSLFSMMFQVYPDKPVRVGDTWEKQVKTGMSNIAMTIDMKYKLSSVKDGVAYIDADGTIKTKGKMTSSGIDVEMDMNGTQKGQMNIGIADGYLKDGQYTMDIDAKMTMQGSEVPVKMKGNYLIKGNE